ncbi:MAG: type II secretion system protein N [Gammaproteobacteria bacterium]|nr:type II secretion system protein N [Gammaproteobacteria bacterium]MCK5262336.1 type II secretion system protein N [Gammaproteobacteria bacterium]
MKIKYYIITGTLALATFLIINIPAAPVIKALKDQLPQIKIQNVSGTLWQGSAQQVTIQSKHVLKNINWSVCISHLLMAEACIEFDAMYNKSPLSGQVSADMNKNIQANNIKTTMSAQALSQMITMPMGEIAGDISVDLETLNWRQGEIPSANGVIKWNKASITIAETAQLGDISITLTESEENPINAKISNQGGQLSIDGLASVNATTDYSLDLSFTPNKKASKNLKDSLSLFAKPQANGSFSVKNSGNLKQLGFM